MRYPGNYHSLFLSVGDGYLELAGYSEQISGGGKEEHLLYLSGSYFSFWGRHLAEKVAA